MNRLIATTLVVIAAVATGSAQAQVYKCKTKDGGSAYQSEPCSADAKPITVQGTRASTLSDGEIANRQTVFKSTDLTSAGVAERSCLSTANDRIYGQSNQRVAGYQQQINSLNRQAAKASNNLAGATYESGLRTQISSLQQSIAQERSTAEMSMNSARQQCADQRAAANKAIEEKYAPPKSAN